jgi:tRNA-splicing ligase RtcB
VPADPAAVSERARARGADQLGTLGSGNHFLEVQRASRIFDPEGALAFGLREGQVTVLIHAGSRGLGRQVCTNYVRRMDAVQSRYRIELPDRQLACAPLDSSEGREYLAAMAAAANFAWANCALLAHRVRESIERILGPDREGCVPGVRRRPQRRQARATSRPHSVRASQGRNPRLP